MLRAAELTGRKEVENLGETCTLQVPVQLMMPKN